MVNIVDDLAAFEIPAAVLSLAIDFSDCNGQSDEVEQLFTLAFNI
jgi:hypothetical protein